jgi:hypothetical protein
MNEGSVSRNRLEIVAALVLVATAASAAAVKGPHSQDAIVGPFPPEGPPANYGVLRGAEAVRLHGPMPRAGYCWYYTDPRDRHGHWAHC